MVRASRFLAVFRMLALPLLACSQTAAPAGEPAVARTAQGVVIAQLVTHDARVAILGSGGDLRVVVRKIDGTMVADGVTLAELRTRDPEIYEVVTSSFAASPVGDRPTYVDATLHVDHHVDHPDGP